MNSAGTSHCDTKKNTHCTFELLRRGRYANLKTAAVTKAAGISQGGLAHHFPSKDILVMAAIEYDTDRAEKHVE